MLYRTPEVLVNFFSVVNWIVFRLQYSTTVNFRKYFRTGMKYRDFIKFSLFFHQPFNSRFPLYTSCNTSKRRWKSLGHCKNSAQNDVVHLRSVNRIAKTNPSSENILTEKRRLQNQTLTSFLRVHMIVTCNNILLLYIFSMNFLCDLFCDHQRKREVRIF